MADIAGTNLAAGIVPFTTEDKYATHSAEYGKGGWHSVANIADRDAIPPQRMEKGMVAFVEADGKAYVLKAFATNAEGTTTSTWEELIPKMDTSALATAEQGSLAETALQPEDFEEISDEEINALFA